MIEAMRDFWLERGVLRSMWPLALWLAVALLVSSCVPKDGDEPGGPASSVVVMETTPEDDGAPGVHPDSDGPGEKTTPEAADLLSDWTLEEKVGQLFMAGIDVQHQGGATYDVIRQQRVGSAFVGGRSQAGIAPVAELVDSLISAGADQPAPMFISTDQEGGKVQVLRGRGISDIPSAMQQSKWTAGKLEKRAGKWGGQLAEMGFNLNLAPVLDVVPDANLAQQNAPIGHFGRNYGYNPDGVASHSQAFSAGMEEAGVEVTLKHFPGLGRVTDNTDVTAHVVDNVIDENAAEFDVFQAGIDADAAFVMMSSAVYKKLDAEEPALFSERIMTDLLRDEMGFEGVIITDDVGAAIQVQQWSPAERAVKFIDAGGDMLLVAHRPEIIVEMAGALTARAEEDADFAAKVDGAVLRILTAKERLNATP